MTNTEVYIGYEHALVGNGKSIGISHIGNVMLSSPIKQIHLNQSYILLKFQNN